MNPQPFISIIILNYFGEKVITNVLISLDKLDYPKDRYEIIVVDNNSRDKSLDIINDLKKKIKNLKLIPLDNNLGFSKGNNVGIKSAKGEYIALLNNDCVVSKNWLKNLVTAALKDPKIFAVAPKILLYQKYLELKIKTQCDLETLYSYVSKSALYKFGAKKLYFNSFIEGHNLYSQVPFDPVSDNEIEIEMVIRLKKKPTKKSAEILTLPNNTKLKKFRIQKNDAFFTMTVDLKSVNSISKIQNAGIIPFQDGYARDIGAIVRDKTQYYEYDEGQYDKESEVYAFCGASVLINKKILNKIGLLDETFFMYYEDVEISERARLNGYKIVYTPKAEVRHIHALTSKEGSMFFVFQVEKGRLLHLLYSYPFKTFLTQCIKIIIVVLYGCANILMSLKYLKAISKDKSKDKPNFARVFLLIRVLLYFLINFPILLRVKFSKKTVDKNAVINNYREITSGRWYFKQ